VSYGLSQTVGVPKSDNDLVAQLLSEALSLLEQDRAAARRRIEDAFALARGQTSPEPAKKGMLAAWQMRRTVQYIRDNLGSPLRIDSVARLANLSASYFSRAFKATMGCSYSEYVIHARLSLAKHLLLTTNETISEIALACGLADQSHLTRLFKRAEGLPPRAWRRRLVDSAIDQARGETPQWGWISKVPGENSPDD
jgi:AraC family transcriptional regulator